MKKIFTIAAALLMTVSLWAQAPEKMSYQAVVRNATNALVTSQVVGVQVSILQGGATGIPVYVETQTPTTNANGLVSLEIGTGTVVSGDFTTIDWANGTYFIKTETDPLGGTTYTITGTSQLMSVPYALHAKTADNVTGTVNYTETDPVFGASIANGITAADTTNWNNHTIVDPTDFNGANPAVNVWTSPSPAPSSTGGVTVTVQSASITVPGPGRIIAIGSVDCYCNAGCNTPGDFVNAFWTLSTSPSATSSSGNYAYMLVNYETTNSSTRTAVFNVTAAGTTNIYLRGSGGGGAAGEIGFYRGQITLMFIPN